MNAHAVFKTAGPFGTVRQKFRRPDPPVPGADQPSRCPLRRLAAISGVDVGSIGNWTGRRIWDRQTANNRKHRRFDFWDAVHIAIIRKMATLGMTLSGRGAILSESPLAAAKCHVRWEGDLSCSTYLVLMPAASYLTKAALAAELMISESTVDDFVRRGLLPPPVRISSGCVRWRWETVDQVLKGGQGQMRMPDEISAEEGVRRVIEAARQRPKPLSRDARKAAQQAGMAEIAELRASLRAPKDATAKRSKGRPHD